MTNGIGCHGTNSDGASDEPVATLSGTGTARRDSMLPLLQGAVVREGARRRARRMTIRRAGAFSLVVALGVSIFLTRPATVNESPVVSNDPMAPTIVPPMPIVRFKSEPGALERYTYVPQVDPAEYIVDDQAFVAVLASIGRPSGLVHRGGRVMLTGFTPDSIRVPVPAGDAAKSAEKR